MRAIAKEALHKCEIFEKFSMAPEPLKLVLTILVKKPYIILAIDIIGLMHNVKEK